MQVADVSYTYTYTYTYTYVAVAAAPQKWTPKKLVNTDPRSTTASNASNASNARNAACWVSNARTWSKERKVMREVPVRQSML